jgi:amino acid transporter
MGEPESPIETGGLRRHFGLLHATALNVSMIVGAGIFFTIPLMLVELPGPYAVVGWVGAGVLVLLDSLIWSELGATLPGSGGTYRYLLECYGRQRLGRLMAFLFVWQFLLSGPLEIASGLIIFAVLIAGLSTRLDPAIGAIVAPKTSPIEFGPDLALIVSPSRVLAIGVGALIIVLLYRRITSLGKLTVTIWIGVLVVIGWILVDGLWHFNRAVAFNFSGAAAEWPDNFAMGLGAAMTLAMYAYLGYYNICYLGDEVRNPGRTIPRAVLLSAALVFVLFVGIHLALLGTVNWQWVLKQKPLEEYNLPADFMEHLHGAGTWAAVLVTVLLLWSTVGSAFAGLLGYSRIPYGAARYGHFFQFLGRVHPAHQIPHFSLLLIGGLSLFWTLFKLDLVINALLVTRILEQFVAQIVGLVLLRWRQPHRPRPFRICLYPLPCGLALAGWLYLYGTSKPLLIVLGLGTFMAGIGAFFAWSWYSRRWPFGPG